jgi:hypothetical protein
LDWLRALPPTEYPLNRLDTDLRARVAEVASALAMPVPEAFLSVIEDEIAKIKMQDATQSGIRVFSLIERP